MFGSTSSSDPGHGIIDMLCLGFCESHINQRAQGQLGSRLPGEMTDFMVVLRFLQSILNGGGTQQFAAYAQRLEVASPRRRWNEYKGGSISYSPTKNLRTKSWL